MKVQPTTKELIAMLYERLPELFDREAPVQEPSGWRPATLHRDNLTFNPGLPDEQTVKFWKLQGVEIEYCYTTPPAAQRQWVGLNERELELIDGMIQVQLDHARRCDGIANRTMAEKQKGWDMERVALLQKIKEKNT